LLGPSASATTATAPPTEASFLALPFVTAHTVAFWSLPM